MSASRPYAYGTTVSEESSKVELETILKRYGATGYGYLWDESHLSISVVFRVGGRGYRLRIPMPARDDKTITHDRSGGWRTARQIDTAYANESRRRWRVIVLGLKSKLELASLNEGDFTFEKEFLHWAVLSDGRTLGEAMADGKLLIAGHAPLMLGSGQ